jgi:iron(III) transport system substrate-binding protein
MNSSVRSSVALSAALVALAATAAPAAERLTLYCRPQEEWCQIMVTAFEKETGTSVAMTRKSSGETYAQIRAEKDNPKGDIWWGGTGDPHLQAAEEGLTEAYTSPLMGELHDWAIDQHEASGGRTVGVYAGALGFGYNKELLAEKGLPEPKCWAD